ncbi:response regulator transcription factor [Nesterenkonia jeotgali]|uniref:DNA-binding NarL/FixJ family response regulator n=1 Tax=Nesterenkonia jeotgali TaxID=317018 RepID=A0A839FJE9_9MICC|nr:response regulator transcription factor [Nesterenkonia jeotgali]MBA8921830.1 DNA-binding NarL/FixJ family response regulator [Nesterenkonia jeotgali]
MSRDRITVVLADDHSSIRAGLRLLLETAEGIEVVGEAADGAAAVGQVSALRPDVVLMDARMPGTDGITATRRIVAESATQVLMLTTFDVDEVVFGALRAGAAGFLLKSVEPAQLIDAIRRVAAGDGILAPEVTRKLLREFAGGGSAGPELEAGTELQLAGGGSSHGPAEALSSPGARPGELSEHLTPRELDVLAALGRGLSNAAIAQELYVSLATVKTHVSNILAKQQLNSRMQAAILAREAGLA